MKFKQFYLISIQTIGFTNSGFLLFPEVLEGLGSSGRLVGTISTILVPISRRGKELWLKTLGRDYFYRLRYY